MELKMRVLDKCISEVNALSKILIPQKLEGFQDIITIANNKAFERILLYPTNDVLLTEEQFCALRNAMNGEFLYAREVGETGKWYDMGQPFYRLSKCDTYEQFVQLPFWSISVFFDETFDWVILIDESLEGGIGLLLASEEIKDSFVKYYPYKRDVDRFEQHFIVKNAKEENLEFAKSVIEVVCK